MHAHPNDHNRTSLLEVEILSWLIYLFLKMVDEHGIFEQCGITIPVLELINERSVFARVSLPGDAPFWTFSRF